MSSLVAARLQVVTVDRIRLTALPKTSFISMQSVLVFRNVSHSIFCKSFQGRPEGVGGGDNLLQASSTQGSPSDRIFISNTYYNLAG